MKCRDRILGKVLNDDVAKVVMMFVGLWLLGTLMSHAQTSLSSKQDIGKRHELYFGVGLLNLYVIDKHDKTDKAYSRVYGLSCYTKETEGQYQLNGRNTCLFLQRHPTKQMSKTKSREKCQ